MTPSSWSTVDVIKRLALAGRVMLMLFAAGGVPRPCLSQETQQRTAIITQDIGSLVEGYDYRPNSDSQLEFRGTSVAPRAEGKISVRTRGGTTVIESRVEALPAPSSLGPYTCYVLWVVTPEGRAANAGTFVLSDRSAQITAQTPLSSFAMIITAEPHFAVSMPSNFVVMLNIGVKVDGAKRRVTSLLARADYGSLAPLPFDPKAPRPMEIVMAEYAVKIAEASGATEFAPETLARAKNELFSAESSLSAKRLQDRSRVIEQARSAVQSAEDARSATLQRKAESEHQHVLAVATAKEAEAQRLTESEAEARKALESARAEVAARQSNAVAELAKRRAALLKRMTPLFPSQASEQGVILEIPGTAFAPNKAALSPSFNDRLIRVGWLLAGFAPLSLQIEGHTDTSGDAEANRKLSLQRAAAVKERLAAEGLDFLPVEVKGFGGDFPIADNSTEDGRGRNRRVMIIVYDSAGAAP